MWKSSIFVPVCAKTSRVSQRNHRRTLRRGHCTRGAPYQMFQRVREYLPRNLVFLFQMLSFNSLNRPKNGKLEDFLAGFENPCPPKTHLHGILKSICLFRMVFTAYLYFCLRTVQKYEVHEGRSIYVVVRSIQRAKGRALWGRLDWRGVGGCRVAAISDIKLIFGYFAAISKNSNSFSPTCIFCRSQISTISLKRVFSRLTF